MPGSLRCPLCLPHPLDVLALDTLLLQIPGNWVRIGNSGILLYRFLVGKFRVCPVKGPLGFLHIPPRLPFLVFHRLPDTVFSQSQSTLRQLLALMSSLHTHIFLFDLVNFVMDFLLQSPQRHTERIMAQLGIGRSVHLLIDRHGFCLAGGFVIDPLPYLFPPLRNILFGSIQTVRRSIGAVDSTCQCWILQILPGKLEPGGLAFFAANVRFRRSAADIFHFSCGQVFGYCAVLCHLLDHFRPDFLLVYGCSPAFPYGHSSPHCPRSILEM